MKPLQITLHTPSYTLHLFHYLLLSFQIPVYGNDIQISGFFHIGFHTTLLRDNL